MSAQPHDDLIAAEAIIGDEAERFVKSELGETILGMAKQEIDTLHLELEKVYPADYVKISEIQERIRARREFAGWLKELINKGREALEAYKHESQN